MRRVRPLLLLLVAGLPGCARESAPAPWPADARAELLRRVAADQAVRDSLAGAMREGRPPDSALLGRMLQVDRENTAWLREALARHGWPHRTDVGEEGAQAAFLLVQHADADTAFQAMALPQLRAAFERGEAEGQHVALLTDRLAVARGEPQEYGSQAQLVEGRFVLHAVRDSARLDARRATMGLPPIGEYLRVLDSVYLGSTRP